MFKDPKEKEKENFQPIIKRTKKRRRQSLLLPKKKTNKKKAIS